MSSYYDSYNYYASNEEYSKGTYQGNQGRSGSFLPSILFCCCIMFCCMALGTIIRRRRLAEMQAGGSQLGGDANARERAPVRRHEPIVVNSFSG